MNNVNNHKHLIGLEIPEATDIAIKFFKVLDLRVLPENSVITLEYKPGRLTLYHNSDNIITEAIYG